MKARLHTAEHILYSILKDKFNVETKAMELGGDTGLVVYLCADNLCDYKEKGENS